MGIFADLHRDGYGESQQALIKVLKNEFRRRAIEIIAKKTCREPTFISLLDYPGLEIELATLVRNLRFDHLNSLLFLDKKTKEQMQDRYIEDHMHLLKPLSMRHMSMSRDDGGSKFALLPHQQAMLDVLNKASLQTTVHNYNFGSIPSPYYWAHGNTPPSSKSKFSKRVRNKPQIPTKEKQLVNSNINKKRRKRK